MNNKTALRLFLGLCLIISFTSCKTAEFGFKIIDINGMVYDFSNRPVAFYDISLGGKYKGSTDINGRFTISKIPVGTYSITGSKTGYENYNENIIAKDRGQIIYIRVPSQNQLLGLVDEALSANNFLLAEEMAERAHQINKNNIEALFYYSIIKFRQKEYDKAADFLETAVNMGSKDIYIDKFLKLIKELK